jgi:hypothetical protein
LFAGHNKHDLLLDIRCQTRLTVSMTFQHDHLVATLCYDDLVMVSIIFLNLLFYLI